ncbi:hypothetical protein [Aquabacterium humicola]|uniref:hypothetical protein n=1 Tax=Aquabacterium humicola TaxID=3237377 RepID=UPI00254368A3|nr:hypothetical protein [Rubrivivax pictus]
MGQRESMKSTMLQPLRNGALALRPCAADEGGEPPCSEVLRDGRITGKRVPGRVLEAALDCSDGRTLLFTTDAELYDESLGIHLLDRSLEVLDSASIGIADANEHFHLLMVHGQSLSFRFGGEGDWSLELLESAAARLPFLGDPPGVHRPFGFMRHFKLAEAPRPVPAP